MQKMNLYMAVDEMRRISAADGTFSVKFRKWNSQKRTGGDMVQLSKARLSARPAEGKVVNGDYKLHLYDTETGHDMMCWQPLLMEFNGHRLVLT